MGIMNSKNDYELLDNIYILQKPINESSKVIKNNVNEKVCNKYLTIIIDINLKENYYDINYVNIYKLNSIKIKSQYEKDVEHIIMKMLKKKFPKNKCVVDFINNNSNIINFSYCVKI